MTPPARHVCLHGIHRGWQEKDKICLNVGVGIVSLRNRPGRKFRLMNEELSLNPTLYSSMHVHTWSTRMRMNLRGVGRNCTTRARSLKEKFAWDRARRNPEHQVTTWRRWEWVNLGGKAGQGERRGNVVAMISFLRISDDPLLDCEVVSAKKKRTRFPEFRLVVPLSIINPIEHFARLPTGCRSLISNTNCSGQLLPFLLLGPV